MRLVHYSNKPLGKLVKKIQGDDTFKPRGLWVSDDDCESNWRSWCLSEEFQLDNLRCAHDVTLADDANILFLRSVKDLDAFSSQWSKREFFAEDRFTPRNTFQMPWKKIRKHYSGLVITPYHWQRRFDLMWYYSWDCASGCIWDPTAIASVVLRS